MNMKVFPEYGHMTKVSFPSQSPDIADVWNIAEIGMASPLRIYASQSQDFCGKIAFIESVSLFLFPETPQLVSNISYTVHEI